MLLKQNVMWSLIGIGLQISFVPRTKSAFLKRINCCLVPVTSTLGQGTVHCSFIAEKQESLDIVQVLKYLRCGRWYLRVFCVGRLVETYSLWSEVYQPITDWCRVLASLDRIWAEMRAFDFCNMRVQISKFCCSLSIYSSMYIIHPPEVPRFVILRDNCGAMSKRYEVAV